MPDGTKSSLNQKGIDFYSKFIDSLIAANIIPMVTLYHWDLPQALQDKGGWPSPDIADLFKDYAAVCFKEFGNRVRNAVQISFRFLFWLIITWMFCSVCMLQVKFWITLNEPICSAWLGYGNGAHAPGIADPVNSTFKAAHNLIRAHAKAYRTYETQFKPDQKGLFHMLCN